MGGKIQLKGIALNHPYNESEHISQTCQQQQHVNNSNNTKIGKTLQFFNLNYLNEFELVGIEENNNKKTNIWSFAATKCLGPYHPR